MGSRVKRMDIDNLTLDEYKQEKFKDIDDKTAELISAGYTYDSKQFSLSTSAQINLSALRESKDIMTYPIKYNTLDDTDTYSVTDATAVENMYRQALAVKKGHLDAGTDLKDQVRAAATKTEVDAVVDNR